MMAMIPWNVIKLQEDLAEARAQIAAKDAALRKVRSQLDDYAAALATIDAALAKPDAQETA